MLPAIGVDVQVLRIQVRDPDRHAARSQYGRTNPRSETILRRASIAVYVGRTTSSPPPGVSSSPRSSARVELRHDLDRLCRKAAVLAAQSHLGGPLPCHDDPVEPGEERLPVHVPDPRDVPPVGDRVVQRDHREPRRAAGDERSHRLVRPGRVLHQQHEQPLVPDLDALEAPESGAEPLQSCLDVVQRRAERERERGGGERVVDVVEPGHGEPDRPALASRRRAMKSTPSRPPQLDVRAPPRRAAAARARRRGSGNPRDGPRTPPRTRTAGRSDRHHFESAACWSSGRACRGSSRPKTSPPGRSRARSPTWGSSPFTTSTAPAGELAHCRPPALGDVLQLAVAVELVPKEVPEADRPGPDTARDLRQSGLVDLEEPQLRAPRGRGGVEVDP